MFPRIVLLLSISVFLVGCQNQSEFPSVTRHVIVVEPDTYDSARRPELPHASPFVAPVAPSAANLIDDLAASLAQQLTESLKTEQTLRVGICPFVDLTGQANSLARTLTEHVPIEISRSRKFEIVQSHREEILAEMRLHSEEYAAMDPSTVKRLGKLMGAEAILAGRIVDKISDLGFECKLIDVETGVMIAVASKNLSKSAIRHVR